VVIGLAGWLLALAACSSSPIALTVDLRTDYVPGRDFTSVVTELGPQSLDPSFEVREASIAADASRDFVRGERVAEFDGVTSGPLHARVRLVDRGGATVAERTVALELDRSFAVTVLITVSCEDVACPAPAGAPMYTQCADGRCVDPRCSPSTPEHCPPPVCAVDSDCPARAGCMEHLCIDGSCLCIPPEGPRDGGFDGGLDAGPPCECTPDETESETRACGACDTGTEERTRTCEASCAWSGWSAWGACTGASGCTPGSTRACPNGEPCGHQTCSSSCTWSSCQLNSGAECFRIAPGSTIEGSNFRCCGTYLWQYCLSGCVWSGACNPCMPTSCPMCS
jgi:hypothetical protein